ncbi:MAG: cellulase family glycosylhydrolase [Prolixibacteraceae bacterium]|nr:cellulase family glycosylhydrolase [Prolixibacteraceae bacterium]
MVKKIVFLFVLSLTSLTVFSQDELPGFRVDGRFLYDACGEKVILRGVSNPNIWFEKNGIPRMAEIAQTGANVVRIVWETRGTAAQLDLAIQNCIKEKMIPMVEVHDATGEIDKVPMCVDYWTKPDVVDVLLKHEKFLLLNIANEPGNGSVSNSKFRSTYQDAITRIREAGIRVPLVIDGTDWGKNIDMMQAEGPGLIEFDPDHNLLFSVHMWWPKMYGFTEQDIIDELAQSAELNLPLIVGEFSQMHGSCEENTITANNSIAYKTIMRECQLNETGYIAWSWFGNCNPFWDMSTKGTFASLYDWGLEVAVTDENSIQNTSVRPYFIVNGECKVGVEELPHRDAALIQHYTDLSSQRISFKYSLKAPAHIVLTIYDAKGRLIRQLVNETQAAGAHQQELAISDFAKGLYFYQFKADEHSYSQKLLIQH